MTMKHITNYLGLLILLTVFSCSQSNDRASVDMASRDMEMGGQAKMELAEQELSTSTAEQKGAESIERKLIKEGRVEFETDDLSATRKSIFEAVDKYKGYVSSDQEYKSPERISNTVHIRVPADSFDDLLKEATQGVEKFDSKVIDVRDVTEEFLDIQARLKTKKELEKRFLELLKQANKVIEILEIEKELGQLRSDIESIEGRLKYLEDRVSLSSLTMTFYESIPNQTDFGRKFKDGFRNGWDNLIRFFVFLTNFWPFVIIGIGLVIAYGMYRRRK
jgi:hypothetical protein